MQEPETAKPLADAVRIPAAGTAMAVRMSDGGHVVATVAQSDQRAVLLTPMPSLALDARVDVAWGIPGGCLTAGGRIIGWRSGDDLWVELGAPSLLERRFFPRVAPSVPASVELVLSGGRRAVRGALLDVSPAGVGFVSDDLVQEGEQVLLSITADETGELLVESSAIVARVEDKPRARIVGCRFEHALGADSAYGRLLRAAAEPSRASEPAQR